jgi:hypothetical protein
MTADQHLEQRIWLRVLRGAGRELDPARLLPDVNHAARLLMNAKRELSRLGVDWRTYLPETANQSNCSRQAAI